MLVALRVKLAQNWDGFSKLLLDTGDRPIVEHSRTDDFWGARPVDNRTLVGMNVLGRLLMELRAFVKTEPRDDFLRVEPLHIADFRLEGRPIEPVTTGTLERAESVDGPPARSPRLPIPKPVGVRLPPTRAPKVAARVVREDSTAYAADQGSGSLKPYPAYKDSRAKWLGEVPEHWEVRTLAQIGKLSKGGGGNKADEVSAGVPCVRYGDLYTTHDYFIRKSRSFVSEEKAAEYTTIRFGDALFAGSGETIDEIGKSAVNLMQAEACCGGDVIVFRPARPINARYIGYAADCRPAAARKATMGRGITVMHIYGTQLRYLILPLPPLPEQAAIVRFLDHADRRIRRYIRAKQKLIALLEEQKQAIIHWAVTGKIDVRTGRPYPAYKPSGLEWLGDVPAHWRLLRLKDVAEVQTGLTLGKQYRNKPTMCRPYLRVANVQEGRLDLTQVKTIDVPLREAEGATLLTGDVLMTEGGDIDKLGRGCVWRDEILGCLHQNHVFAVRCRQSVLRPEYLVGLMASQHGRAYFELTAKQTTNLASTNSSTLRAFPVPMPILEDQRAIIQVISEEIDTRDNAIGRAEQEIDLIREYRTRLIADVVTGKLDVREAAAGLPEVDPLAAEDDPEDGSNPKTLSDGDQVGVTGQEAEA